jgi:hypothetical protein
MIRSTFRRTGYPIPAGPQSKGRNALGIEIAAALLARADEVIE